MCPAGFYNTDAAISQNNVEACVKCPAGKYCLADPLVADAWTKDIACPEGYVCPDYSAGATAYSA